MLRNIGTDQRKVQPLVLFFLMESILISFFNPLYRNTEILFFAKNIIPNIHASNNPPVFDNFNFIILSSENII